MTRFRLVDASGAEASVPIAPAAEPAAGPPPASGDRIVSRRALAAAHVIPRASADNVPGAPADLDWDQTLAFRHHLWSHGLGVADAMDTAQRNMGLDWATCQELIRRSAREAAVVGGDLVVGVGTDQLADDVVDERRIVDAYLEQLRVAEDAGAGVVLMASRHVARIATSADDYHRIYGTVLARAGGPVILHWLGPVFDPRLEGYFGGADNRDAAAGLIRIIEDNVSAVAGVKVSVLDRQLEIDLRGALPPGVRVFTGDDYHYADLIAGDAAGHSDALLGAFAAIAPLAARALRVLDTGDTARAADLLRSTEPLSRIVFEAPTPSYKTGVAFLSWLNGHQSAFAMVGGMHASRSIPHLSRLVAAANACGALEDPELAAERWHGLLRLAGL